MPHLWGVSAQAEAMLKMYRGALLFRRVPDRALA